MKNKFCLLSVLIALVSLTSCDKKENHHNTTDYSFSFETDYDSIRSCPGGRGMFIIELHNSSNLLEKVNLSLKCDENLNATLTKESISPDHSVFEIIIRPDNNIPVSDYIITLTGKRKDQTDSLNLYVHIVNWSDPLKLSEIASNKKTEFILWLNTNYPSIKIDNQTEWEIFLTYPQTLIVEHYTLLSEYYEMRLCCHIMIPPHDWSMIRLRERNCSTPFIAARQDSAYGSIHQIPVEEYPILYGY